MNDLSFVHGWVLAGLALPPVLLAAWVLLSRRAAKRAATISRVPARGPRTFGALCIALSLVAAIVAAAQPRWGTEQSQLPRTGAQLVVVLDVSRSMAATDVAPNRLDAAKSAVNATIARLGGDRVGLVQFAGDARLRFPLTTDFGAASQVISSLQTGSIIVSTGTSTSSGLEVALTAFDSGDDGGKLILLIADGDDLGADPAGVAQQVRDSGVELLIVGAGTASGAPVPVFDTNTGKTVEKKAGDGSLLVTKLNEPFLGALAAAAGGRYLGSDMRVVPGAVAGRLAALQQVKIAQETATVPIERYPWFAAAALALLVLGWTAERLPRPSRRAALLPAGLLLMLLLGACATEAHDLNAEGIAALERGDTERAIALFSEARTRRPSDARITLNLALAYHAAGHYDDATLAARRALTSRDAELRGQADATIGHARFALKDLPGALDAFRQALIENPADRSSRHDYEVVLRLLAPPQEGDPQVQQPPDATPTPTQDPGQEQEPGQGQGTPVPGRATPPPGQGQGQGTPPPGAQPGQGTPLPGQGTPGTGQGQGQGTPQPGAPQQGQGQGQGGEQGGTPGPSTPGEVDRQVTQLDRQITRLIEQAGERPTPAQAAEILRLLAERDRIAAIRDALAGGGDPNDY